jgi:transcriptional regulator with XRE-family HTH domain
VLRPLIKKVRRILMGKPSGRARELGAMLRKHRVAAGWTEIRLARTLSLSHPQICRIELGERSISDLNVARCLTLFGVFGQEHDEIIALAKEVNDSYRLQAHNDRLPDELRTLIHYETTATSIDSYQPSLIPGMLQTEDYARSVFHCTGVIPEDGIEPRIKARMDRQRLLNWSRRPSFRFFIHEIALHPPMIGEKIMHEQHLMLLLACSWEDCEIRILPAEAPPIGVFGGPFMFMRYADYLPTVYVENFSTSAFLEDPTDIQAYRAIVYRLASVALNEGQSREMLANLAG